MTRKQARDIAFKLIYQSNLTKQDSREQFTLFIEAADGCYVSNAEYDSPLPNDFFDKEGVEYIGNTIHGIAENRELIDQTIKRLSLNWEMERISSLSIAALRLGLYELIMNRDIPGSVAINESTDLISLYETPEAANFVNGLLATAIREITVEVEVDSGGDNPPIL